MSGLVDLVHSGESAGQRKRKRKRQGESSGGGSKSAGGQEGGSPPGSQSAGGLEGGSPPVRKGVKAKCGKCGKLKVAKLVCFGRSHGALVETGAVFCKGCFGEGWQYIGHNFESPGCGKLEVVRCADCRMTCSECKVALYQMNACVGCHSPMCNVCLMTHYKECPKVFAKRCDFCNYPADQGYSLAFFPECIAPPNRRACRRCAAAAFDLYEKHLGAQTRSSAH